VPKKAKPKSKSLDAVVKKRRRQPPIRHRLLAKALIENAKKPPEERKPEYQIAMELDYPETTARHRLWEIKKGLAFEEAFEELGFDDKSAALHILELVNAKKTIFHQGLPITKDVVDWATRESGLKLYRDFTGIKKPLGDKDNPLHAVVDLRNPILEIYLKQAEEKDNATKSTIKPEAGTGKGKPKGRTGSK